MDPNPDPGGPKTCGFGYGTLFGIVETFEKGRRFCHSGMTVTAVSVTLKGSLTRDFRLQVFFLNQCAPGP
jgi:hypothetical protein